MKGGRGHWGNRLRREGSTDTQSRLRLGAVADDKDLEGKERLRPALGTDLLLCCFVTSICWGTMW